MPLNLPETKKKCKMPTNTDPAAKLVIASPELPKLSLKVGSLRAVHTLYHQKHTLPLAIDLNSNKMNLNKLKSITGMACEQC